MSENEELKIPLKVLSAQGDVANHLKDMDDYHYLQKVIHKEGSTRAFNTFAIIV